MKTEGERLVSRLLPSLLTLAYAPGPPRPADDVA